MNIFIAQNGSRIGPFSLDDLRNRVAQGETLLSDLAWHEGRTEWVPLHQIPEILDQVIPPLDKAHSPKPDVSDVQKPRLPTLLPPRFESSPECSKNATNQPSGHAVNHINEALSAGSMPETYRSPGELIRAVTGAEILGVLPCRIKNVKSVGFRKRELFYTASLSVLIIPAGLGLITLCLWVALIVWAGVDVTKMLRFWSKGLRKRPNAVVITKEMVILVNEVCVKIPENLHFSRLITKIPLTELTEINTPKMDSENYINFAGKLRIQTTAGHKFEIAPVGMVLNLNSHYTRYYQEKVVSFKEAKQLIRTLKTIVPVILFSIFLCGCATDKQAVTTPTPQELAWAEKTIELDKQYKALQLKEQELKQKELGIQDAKAQAWLEQNKVKIVEKLTESYRPSSQQMLESFGFHGTVLDYLIDDVALDGNTLILSQLFLWRNTDDTGDIARINVGLDINNVKTMVGSRIVGTRHLSQSDLASLMGSSSAENNSQVQSMAPPSQPASATSSVWAPSKDTVNTA